MKKLTLALLFIMSNGLLFANHWTPEGGEFEDNMTLTGVIQFNGVEQQSASLEVGVFCGEQCRGSEIASFFPPAQRYVIMLTIFGKTGNDFTFKLFDHATGQELNYNSPEAVSFNADGYGNLMEPFVLNFTSTATNYTISASANPAEGGTVSGAGSYLEGTTCTLTATPNSGYTFVNWTENGNIVSTSTECSFSVNGNRTLVANFTDASYHYVPQGEEFEDNMTITAIIQIDGVEQQSNTLEVGVFCGGQCRGREIAGFFPPTQRYVVMLTVFGRSGNDFTFKLFDHAVNQELNLNSPDAITFNADGYGNLMTPFVLNFTSSISSFTFLGSETDHNWSTASNWQENMVPQSGSEVVINGLCNLDQDATVNTITINEDYSLTIQRGMKLTATDVASDNANCLVINDGGQLFTQTEETVYATVKKDIAAYMGTNDNYYFVAPAAFTASKYRIKTNTTNMLSGEYDLYWFDQFSPAEEWQNYEADPFTYLSMKQGYLYANSANTTLAFAGKLITTEAEDVELEYDDEESVFPGFTLIGNPFPCNATVSGECLAEDAYYVMNEQGGRKNIIVTMNPVVAPCTGLFAVAANEDAVVTFTPSASDATVRGSQSCIRMESFDSLNQLEDRLYVKTVEGNGLQKFSLDSHATRLYVNSNGKDYAVVPFIGSSEMTVNFTTETYGWHTISVSPENLSCDYLHLIDNLTGADIDLLAASNSYTFEAKPSDYASRFRLEFNVTGVEDNAASTSSASFACMSNGNLVIDHIEGEAILQIIDMTGRSISSEKVNGNYNKHLNLNAGVYVLNLNGMTQKIVVK